MQPVMQPSFRYEWTQIWSQNHVTLNSPIAICTRLASDIFKMSTIPHIPPTKKKIFAQQKFLNAAGPRKKQWCTHYHVMSMCNNAYWKIAVTKMPLHEANDSDKKSFSN